MVHADSRSEHAARPVEARAAKEAAVAPHAAARVDRARARDDREHARRRRRRPVHHGEVRGGDAPERRRRFVAVAVPVEPHRLDAVPRVRAARRAEFIITSEDAQLRRGVSSVQQRYAVASSGGAAPGASVTSTSTTTSDEVTAAHLGTSADGAAAVALSWR